MSGQRGNHWTHEPPVCRASRVKCIKAVPRQVTVAERKTLSACRSTVRAGARPKRNWKTAREATENWTWRYGSRCATPNCRARSQTSLVVIHIE